DERLNRFTVVLLMSVSVAGMGWVTPLGSGISEVWERLLAGDTPQPEEVQTPRGKHSSPPSRVPATALKNLPPHPRLRRASAISRFAVAAGIDALAEARSKIGEMEQERRAWGLP